MERVISLQILSNIIHIWIKLVTQMELRSNQKSTNSLHANESPSRPILLKDLIQIDSNKWCRMQAEIFQADNQSPLNFSKLLKEISSYLARRWLKVESYQLTQIFLKEKQ